MAFPPALRLAPVVVVVLAGCASETIRPPDPGFASAHREMSIARPESVPRGEPSPPPSPRPHSSFSAFFDTHFASDAWREEVWEDYLTEPPVLLPVALGAAALVVSFWDEDIQDAVDDTWSSSTSVGDVGLGVLVVGAVVDGYFAPAPGRTTSDELWAQGEAFAVNLGLTEALKLATRRLRPDEKDSASFPSGHASTAFTAATLIERNAGLGLGIPAYALAALTAYTRVESGRHFPSDVLAGAALGTLTASVIDALHFGRKDVPGRRGIAAPDVDVQPVDGGGLMLGVSWRF